MNKLKDSITYERYMHKKIKQDLAHAYHIIAHLGLDDHTYTHLSARVPEENCFYIYPFGLRFEEVTPECLLRVSLDGEVQEGKEYQYNRTGFIIHGSIYRHRPDINAIFHLHTPATVAVSSMQKGLLPLSQWALHFYGCMSYHVYNSLALDYLDHGDDLVNDLGKNNAMLLHNHGSLTCGKTIEEAMFYTYHLEQACKTQCLVLQSSQPLILPDNKTCQKAVSDLLSFETNLGERDWQAWLRMISKL